VIPNTAPYMTSRPADVTIIQTDTPKTMTVNSLWIIDDQSDNLTVSWEISFVDQSFITVLNSY